MELIRLGKTQGGFVALSQIEEKFPEAMRTEKGLDHVTELLGRSLIYNWSGGRRGYRYARKHLLR